MAIKKQWKSKKPYKKTWKAKSVLARSPSSIKTSPIGVSRGLTQKDKFYTFTQRVSGEALTLYSTPLVSVGGIAKYMRQTNAEDSYSFAFCLNDLSQKTTFTGLFDEYRFDKVVVNFRPLISSNVNASTALTAAGFATQNLVDPGTIIIAIDNDDYSDATSDALRQVSGSQIFRCIQPNDIVVTINRPKISTAVYQGAFTGYGSTNSWIDCETTAVQHFGVKCAIDAYDSTAPTPQHWCVDCEYTVSFRGVR